MSPRKGFTEEAEYGIKRAVIYARYSSHNQREESIEQQVKKCQEYAKRNGYTVIEIYSDKAITGKTDERPQFQRMMRDSRKGTFDYVIAWKSNRIGRNMLQAMVNASKLAEQGVKCLYVEEDFDDTAAGRFALRNMMNVNQFYSENMAEDIRRGMMDNAEKCKVNGKIAYGFKKGADGRYEIQEDEAAIVREIFDRLLVGWKQSEIISDLNARGIKNHGDKTWKPSSFNKMLQNEQYIGVYKFAEVRIEGGIPAIVDRRVFEEVQHKLATKKNPRGRKRDVADYLLTGKLFCGKCEEPMVGVSGTSRTGVKHYYYVCRRKRRGLCDKKNVLREDIEAVVLRAVRSLIMDDETIDWIIAGYQQFIELARQESSVGAMEKELEDVKKSLANLLKAIEAGIITDTTRERMVELEDQRRDLETSIRLENEALRELSADEMRFIIEDYRDRNLDDPEYQKELIRLFIQAVYVYDDHLKIVVNSGKGGGITVPFSDVDSVESHGASGSYKIPSAPPVRNDTNHPADMIVYLHLNGIILVVPYQEKGTR